MENGKRKIVVDASAIVNVVYRGGVYAGGSNA